jgi:pSer/pThr/pTyr-binding forkhead associated (FHA) protein
MVAMLILRALTGVLRGQEITFRAPACYMVGRSLDCQLQLPSDGSVSRQHCLVELDGAGAWVQDLGSRNGTHLNGMKIGQRQDKRDAYATVAVTPRQELRHGDELQVGHHLFAVVLSSPPQERRAR